MSRGITVTILAGLVLTACLTTGGCRRRSAARDHTWHDASGKVIAENWKTDAAGKRVPDPHPRDRYGKPWVYDANGDLVPPAPPPGTSSARRSGGLFLWGGSGFRSSSGSGTSYRSGSSSSPSSSSIGRSGFGSTGSSSGG